MQGLDGTERHAGEEEVMTCAHLARIHAHDVEAATVLDGAAWATKERRAAAMRGELCRRQIRAWFMNKDQGGT